MIMLVAPTAASAFAPSVLLTVTGYLEEYRINQSLSLVQSGQYSMIQIADMTGFSNASRFARAFRKQFGCNPGEYNSLKQHTV